MPDLLKVMEREMLCSEHAAQCFLEAKRRDIAKRKAARSRGSTVLKQLKQRDANTPPIAGK